MAKKTIAKVAAIILVLAVAAFSFSGCTFIRENPDRVANQEVITIKGAGGITLTLSQNEILDYYNSYAYYLIQYYNYTPEKAMDFVIESKVKNKYLLTIAMGELINTSKYPSRVPSVLVGGGSHNNIYDVLTHAEYYAAVHSVNDSIKQSLDSYIDEVYQDTLRTAANTVSLTNVQALEFTEDTLAYLKDEYVKGENLDTDKIKFRVVYQPAEEGGEPTYSDIDANGNKLDAPIVPATMYDTAFTSESAGEDLSIVISVDEKITDENGKVSYEKHTATHSYKVIEPRATKTVSEEELGDDDIKIGDVTVGRYDSLATLTEKLDLTGELAKIDVDAKHQELLESGENNTLREAYRRLAENLKKGYKTMDYIYNSAFESALSSALQAEVSKIDEDSLDADILAEFKFSYLKNKDTYANLTDEKEIKAAFGSSIKSNLDAYYYHPAIQDLSDYIYVYQILFNFSEEQKAFITNNAGADEAVITAYQDYFFKNHMITKQSNPNFDAEKWAKEIEEGTEQISRPYIDVDENGEIIDESVYVVFKRLEGELQAIQDGTSTTGKTAFETFEDYMYRYNDDGGIMNSKTGYLIAPEGTDDPNGFYQSFVDLAHDVYSYQPSVGNAFVGDGELGYRFTDYGVHLIMVSMKPFSSDFDNSALDLNDEDMLSYIKNTVIDLEGNTIYDVIKDKVVTDRKSQAYNNFTSSNIKSDIHEDKNIVVINEKKLAKIYEDYAPNA
ncbi:MAG: hypothetical protein WC292_05570 [Clostridia bacterium]